MKKYVYQPYSGRRGKSWLRIPLCLVLLCVLGFAALLAWVLSGAHDDINGDPQTMILLGCQVKPWGPSTLLQDRLDKALDYLKEHPDMTVVVSGGQGPDEHISEAQCMFDYLTEHGVPEGQILREEASFNTLQNLQNSVALLNEQGYDISNGVLIVSNGFHLTRSRMLGGRVGLTCVSTLAAPSSHAPSRWKMYLREPLALAKSLLLDR